MAVEGPNRARDRIVSGHVGQTVWWLAWPSVLTMFLGTVYMLVDARFVVELGAAPLAGLGLANQVLLILMAFSTAISVGSTALVARFVGSKDTDLAEEAARQSLLLAVLSGIVSGILLFALGPSLITWMGKAGEPIPLALVYLNVLLAGNIPSFVQVILLGIYRGLGDVRTPLIASIIATAINIAGDYVLIFGIGPFPRFGIGGAGIAVIISRSVSTLLLLARIPRSHIPGMLSGSWKPAWGWFRRILNIGYPAAVQAILRTGASMTYFWILRRALEGQDAIAALTIGIRMESIAFMPGFAFSVAAASMVGQNLGAQQPDRARKGARAAAWQGIWVMGAIGLLFIVFSRPLAWYFADGNPEVAPLASSYLWINGLSEPFLALAMVLTGALQGAGETRLPAAATILTLWIIRLPLTYLLAITLNFGAVGAWVGMSASTVLSGLTILAIFKRSNWEEKEV